MSFKKERYQGVEYHFPATFESAADYVASLQLPQISIETENAMKWDDIRIKRDRLIAATDWTQTLDCQLTDEKKAEFVTYRQALRDIPKIFENKPDDIVWPEKPDLPTK